MKKIMMLFAISALIMVACNDKQEDEKSFAILMSASAISGLEDGVVDEVRAMIQAPGQEIMIASAEVKDKSFTIELPEISPEYLPATARDYFSSFFETATDVAEVSDSKVRISSPVWFEAYYNGEYAGYFFQRVGDLRGINAKDIIYYFVNGDVVVVMEKNPADQGRDWEINLDLRKGWNRSVYNQIRREPRSLETTNISQTTVTWIFIPEETCPWALKPFGTVPLTGE